MRWWLAALLTMVATGASAEPFGRAELLAFLKANVPYWAHPGYDAACARAAATVAERGLSFSYDGSFDPELHAAGACPPVVRAMTKAASGPSPRGQAPTATASPPSRAASAPPAVPGQRPRMGRYQIWSYGNVTAPLLVGYVDLSADASYAVLDRGQRPVGKGRYAWDGSGVRWTTGPYAAAYGRSVFETQRDGARHVLKLNRVTIATNSGG